jgi:DNA-binding XRE family transcriptional regulator
MTAAEFKRARETLGYTPQQMAAALGLATHGKRTIQRIENEGATITGPMSLAVQKLLDDRA